MCMRCAGTGWAPCRQQRKLITVDRLPVPPGSCGEEAIECGMSACRSGTATGTTRITSTMTTGSGSPLASSSMTQTVHNELFMRRLDAHHPVCRYHMGRLAGCLSGIVSTLTFIPCATRNVVPSYLRALLSGIQCKYVQFYARVFKNEWRVV